jgi:hypothetical protein
MSWPSRLLDQQGLQLGFKAISTFAKAIAAIASAVPITWLSFSKTT